MADYLPLIAKAITGLEKNTGEARRALYERARTALVAQLRGMNPPLSESDITRERLALEEAIRKVEAEAARKIRMDLGQSLPPAAPPAPPPPAPPPAPPVTQAPTGQISRPQTSISDQGLRGFRSVVEEAEALGARAADASRGARETYRSTLDEPARRIEPDYDDEPPPPPRREPIMPRPIADERPVVMPPAYGGSARNRRDDDDDADAVQRSLARRAALRTAMTISGILLLIIAVLGTAYWQRERITSLFTSKPGGTVQTTQVPGPGETGPPKLDERVPAEGQRPSAGGGTASGAPAAAVAQRVVLYEEDPADPAGRRMVGSVIWRTETVSPGPGLPPELAVKANVDIPERRMAMTLTIRRNADATLPASHTAEVVFNLPNDFQFGGVNNVPGILLKQAEQSRGQPLAGLAVKVTTGFFLIGLSSGEADRERNLQLLRERPWFDIPMVYNNGRRAILAIEKGTPGERAINDALRAWGN
jgi:hypothetical protein